MSQFFIFLLMADAAIVVIGLSRKRNMWPFIVLYWALLTAKNAVDFLRL